ncbi:MAG: anaerobic glycerol-3-phosphate dehydrogenase subunit GlpC [Marinifilaceae bacterium]
MNRDKYNISDNDFEQCIKCTVCTVYCPVTAVTPLFPGPKQAGPDGERLRLKKSSYYDKTLKYCLNCKRCEVACPSGVKIGDIIQSARIKYETRKPKLRDKLLANTDFVGTMSTAFAPIVNNTISLKPVKYAMEKVLAIDAHRQFPEYASEKFESWYKKHAAESQKQYKHQVSYFHGCYVNYNFPQLGKDLVKILNAVGYGVNLLDKEKCCGVALISNRLINQAKKDAQHNIAAIEKAVNDDMQVIGTSSTCIFTIRDEYKHILEMDNSKIRNHVELATRFLYRLIDEKGIKLAFKKDFKLRVAYHTPCHMGKLGWSIYSTSLLKMIPTLDFVLLDSFCCGIAGTYGFKKENYETSQAIGKPLFKNIEESGADLVVTDCETCKWQIEMSTSLKVKNPISIIADALDVEETIRLNKE